MIRAAFRVLLLVFIGCTGLHAGAVRIDIAPVFAGDPVRLDSLRYTTGAGEELSVTRLSYLISGLAFERATGGWVEVPGFAAWFDLQQHRNFCEVLDVPAGSYRAVRFNIGLDPATNNAPPESFPAESPLNPAVNGLHWSWQGGFIFLALEGQYRSGSSPLSGYALHIAKEPNRTQITLTGSFAAESNPQLQLEFDLRTFLNAPHPVSFATDGNATHSRPEDPLANALSANLRNGFRIHAIIPRTVSAAPEPAVEPRLLPAKYTPFRFEMGRAFPVPALPKDNPLIVERVELGRRLFHDPQLSRTGRVSCASCHRANAALADPRTVSRGVLGRTGSRNAPPLFNLAWKTGFFWDARASTLREQVLRPIEDHNEMDLALPALEKRLTASGTYAGAFRAAFGSPQVDAERISLALEQFLLTLTSFHSHFDKVQAGIESFTPEEERGFELFSTEFDPRTRQFGADCFHCHGGALFTDNQLHNNGLEETGTDRGRYNVTRSTFDRDKFVTPSLRNVELTAPYMHDGRFETLEEVVEHYATGVHRGATLDPNLAKHPPEGISLSPADKAALVAFLRSLTDDDFVETAREARRLGANDVATGGE